MSEKEKKLVERLAESIGNKLTDEENAYVKGVADGMVFSRQLKEKKECNEAKLANA